MWHIALYSTGLYGNSTSTSGSSSSLIFVLLIYLVAIVVMVVALWKIFTKAGRPGWNAIIPVYNTIVELNIVGLSGWYFFLFVVPLVNIFMGVWLAYRLSKSFGYGVGMTILCLLFGIGLLIIAFGDSKYLGPNGQPGPGGAPLPNPGPPAPAAPTPPQPPVVPQPPAPAV